VKTTRWVLLSALLTAFAAQGAEVYRSTDANGVVRYSDRPDADNSQAVYVSTPRAGRPGNTVAPREVSKPAKDEQAPKDGEQPGERQQTPEELAAMRAKNCQTARERADKYAVSHRLFRELPNGERAYLNDAEIDEAKAKAAADVKTWCD
jgi:Domain of unknown function (DUF4124)